MGRGADALSRRELLAASAAVAVTGCSAAVPRSGTVDPQSFDHAKTIAFEPARIGQSETLFPQTVASGAMRPGSVVLWTRAVGVASVTLRVWRDLEDFSRVALVTDRTLEVPSDGNVKVQVEGLAPGPDVRPGRAVLC